MNNKNTNKLIKSNADYVYNPSSCVFVSANAGSGKTSLLTSRVLSLLLHGVEPSKILCLTFTNAAAAEMNSRILKSLGKWVMADDKELSVSVSQITGENPSDVLLKRARSLFAHVLESPQGVNIQTIHGFSQSLLRRFPLEAGVSPYFSVMDSRSEQEALAEARLRLFNNAKKSDFNIQISLDSVAKLISESGFHKLMNEIVASKQELRSFIQHFGHIHAIQHKLYSLFSLKHGITLESLIAEYLPYDERHLAKLRMVADLLLKSDKKTDTETGSAIAKWLESDRKAGEILDEYTAYLVLESGEGRKKLFTKAALADEELIEALLEEQKRFCEFSEKKRALYTVNHTLDVLHISEALLAEYEAIKRLHAWMDYDDLILTACELLNRSGMSPWVLFKLDGGIDHILVDEAQDTSPIQWQIIHALTQEFFAGEGAREVERSIFIVGDEKQSIYSFQGADVRELENMRKHFDSSITAAQRQFHSLSLTKSYRSTEAVLKVVDAVFAQDHTKKGVTFTDGEIKHILTRDGHTGLVELWPLIKPSENEEEKISPVTILARHIADEIKVWIDRGEAKAGDIMILLRSRTSFADRLTRALKRRGVAVAGSDRMALNDNLAVQDLIALGQILLLPDDDLTLAACLKSPIFNISEDELFALSYGRGKKTLWQRLQELPEFSETHSLIVDLRSKADFVPPFELYSYLLNQCGARARFVGRMGEECSDPIDEFMQQTLLYERSHPPSLQGFIHWISESKSVIKRDMEQARDMVRIMTVHGAKGLQAKIVILPDTVEVPREQESLLWCGGIPVRSIAVKHDDSVLRKLKAERQAETLNEYRRLLYVALTRAEDRLYICGATGKEKASEQSWYNHIKAGMEKIATKFESKLGEGLRVGDVEAVSYTHSSITASAGDSGLEAGKINYHDADFSFLEVAAPSEPSPTRPLTPSRLSGENPAVASPLASKDIYAVGKLVHLLLQYLPAQEEKNRKEAAKIIAGNFSSQLAPENIDKAVTDVLAVMANPEFSFLFSAEAMAEVPVTGNVEVHGNNITISGQIDRLYIGASEVWIVDFKSNNLPPQSPAAIPKAYIRQLALYRLLLQKITPDKKIKCALLWTATAKLDVVADDILERSIAQ